MIVMERNYLTIMFRIIDAHIGCPSAAECSMANGCSRFRFSAAKDIFDYALSHIERLAKIPTRQEQFLYGLCVSNQLHQFEHCVSLILLCGLY